MRLSQLVAIVLCTASLSVLQEKAIWADPPIPMPETFSVFSEDDSYPDWVSARRILTPQGAVDPALFRASMVKQIPALLSLPEKEGCIRLGPVMISYLNPPVRADVSQAVKTADVVLLGRVTGLAPGIRELEAGNLVRVEPVEVLKGESKIPQRSYFIFIPVGDFTVGSKRICKTDSRYVSLPEVGDRLMLFVTGRLTEDVAFLSTQDEGGMVLLRNNSIELPEPYRGDPLVRGMNPDRFIDFIKQLVRGDIR